MYKNHSDRNKVYLSPPKYKQSRKISACLIALLSLTLLSAMAFGQGASASITGMVTDPSGAVIPGATVVATNVETGVTTRTTANNAGAYNYASLQTGTYTVAAEASGFTSASITDVRLTIGAQIRLNIPLTVAGTVTEVSVSGSAESLSLEAGASTGILMQEQMIQSVPLLSGSVMDMVAIMGGVSTNATGTASSATMAGIGSSMNINVVRDGVSVNEVRMPVGIAASTNINQEMIGEFRVVLAPVDAEMGRGAGQVQMTTRSGSNTFRGSAVWNVQNTALDSLDFSRKLSGAPPSWRNLNSYILSASGPVIRNRTFFFVTWEQQFARDKLLSDVRVLTSCARKGIYRYLGGTVPDANNVIGSYNASTMAVPSVNSDGSPRTSGMFYNVNNPDQTFTINPTTNALHIESIFGEFTDTARTALLAYNGADGVWGNCSGINLAPQTTTAWSNDTSGFYSSSITPGNLLKPNSYWGEDIYRSAYDPTGYAGRFIKSNLSEMPPANNFETGDGLNLAGYRWHVPFVGTGASVFGTGGDPDRKSITVKIDHNINNDHRLSGTFTKEYFFTNDVNGQSSPGGWPRQYGGYNGDIIREPVNFLFSLTSTLRPTLLNELRFGLNRTNTWTHNPIDTHNELNQVLADLMSPSYAQGVQTIIGAGEGQFLFHTDMNGAGTSSHPIASRNMLAASWGGHDPRFTISDTITWMKGVHSFKAGFEYRKQSSIMEYSGMKSSAPGGGALMSMPTIWGGTTTLTSNRRNALSPLGAANINSSTAWQDLSPTSLDTPTTTSGNYTTPYQMMTFFSGSVNQARQYFYYVPDRSSPTGARWNDTLKGENWWSQTLKNQEFSFFFKDDWKVTSDLTLNLGIRYEYYGIASVEGGTLKMMGNSFDSAFGVTKGGWANWMHDRQMVESVYDPYMPGTSYIPNYPAIGELGSSGYTLVGPGSQNPGTLPYSKDTNNFGPHIGFSWQLPWFGRGLTTLRGGWSISYLPVNDFNFFEVVLAKLSAANTDRVERFTGLGSPIGGVPGSTNDSTAYYMDMTNLNKAGQGEILGNSGYFFEPTRMPLENFRIGELMYPATVMDENIKNPYVHSFNMAVTRQIGRAVTLDVRYVGTMSQNMIAGANGGGAAPINSVRYINNISPAGYNMLTELEKVRAGGYESPLLNSLIPQASLFSGGGGGGSGSNQLLNATSTSANMATGQYAGVVGTLATGNGLLAPPVSGLNGMIFRGGCLPEDRDGYLAAYANNPTVNAYSFDCLKGTPWNYYLANPQYTGVSLQYNAGSSNYHSMQTQVTMRPTKGLSFQTSYTWSRNLGDTAYSNYLNDPFTGRDYILAGNHRSHALNIFGSYELPFGTKGFLLRNASGVLKKVVEDWQLNWITTMSSGVPVSVTGTSGQWTNNRVDLVRPDLWDNKAGKISTHWRDDNTYLEGRFFGEKFIKVLDRAICDPNKMTATLYTLNCEYSSGGQMLLRASAPRALALHSGEYDRFGNPIPVSYSSVQDGVAKGDQLAQTYYDANAGRELTPVIIFRNHYQGYGTQGNFKQNQLTGQGRFTFDLAMSKAVEFMEGKRFEIRVDAQNILNHPTATASTLASNGGRVQSINGPNLSINNATTFGLLATKGGHRTFQARLRLSF